MITPLSLAALHSIAIIVAGSLGLLCGSFLNVCIRRLPLGESILTPRSHCPHCQHPIGARDNIPVFSWILLRRRCRYCRQPISVQYPLVELATATLFAACVAHTGLHSQTLLDIAMTFLLLGLAIMDAQTFLLPDLFTVGGIILAIMFHAFQPMALQGPPSPRLAIAIHYLLAALLAALLLLLVRWVYRVLRHREGMGLGDVKLLAMIAAFLGLPLTLLTLFLAVVSAASFALWLLTRNLPSVSGSDRSLAPALNSDHAIDLNSDHALARRCERPLPFGSFLATSGIVVIFVGRPLLHWYLSFFP